jgi:hypothetical protein
MNLFSRTACRAFVAIVILSCLTFALNADGAQSGRRKDNKAKPRPAPSPIAETNRPVYQNPTTPTSQPTKEPGDDVDEADVVRVSSNLVPIPASVVDNKGLALTSLRVDDFELRVDGQLRPISDISRADSPVRMVMLFDNSGSLDMARGFEKHAAQPMTRDVRRLEQTIESFGKPEGATSLFDAIIAAAAYLRPYSGRRVIVIVSDGIETTSRADFETTMHRVLADDCQIYVVQTGLYDGGANLRALAAERRMEQLAAQTGGAAYIPKTTSALDTAFQEIAADLAQQYVLSYYQAEENRDGRFHAIELRIKSRKDVRVRARRGYYSPKRSSVASDSW